MTKIVFLILPKVHLLDLAGPDQVFLEAMDFGVNIQVEYCSYTEGLATSTQLPFGTLKHFNDIVLNKGDFIVVPGADSQFLLSPQLLAQKELFDWIKKAYEKKVRLCSICTGAYFLALTGLLDGKKCTTHWKHTMRLQSRFSKLKVIENILFVEDNGIFTSAGVTAGIDLALHIVGLLKDDSTSFKVARELVVYARRSGNDSQQSVFLSYRNHIHAGVHKVQDWLQDNLNKKCSLQDLSEVAMMSTRTLTRIFKKETGITINEYITLLRKERISELMKNPDISRHQIARQCGLESVRHVTRLISL
ncbi:MAG: DJ-1/PfpI family protein [Saprospiraceae bacterium]|nr:DJ-1/PfpI family protein [Saprospiraceae bacterium]